MLLYTDFDSVADFSACICRYQLSGTEMPSLRQWIQDTVGVSLDFPTPSQPEITAGDIPTPIHNEDFMKAIRKERLTHSDDPQDRLFRAHGNCYHSAHYLFTQLGL